MSGRDYVKTQIDLLPEDVVESIIQFISFQKFSMGMYDDDTEYLSSMPGVKEKIIAGMNTSLSECVSRSEVWDDV